MGAVVVMTTVPGRPGAEATWNALVNGAPLTAATIKVADHCRDGQRATYWRALAVGLRELRAGEELTVVEDDVSFAPGFLDMLTSYRVHEGAAFTSWFGNAPGVARVPRGGRFMLRNAADFEFCQAVTFTPWAVAELLSHPLVAAWGAAHGGDSLVASIGADLRWTYRLCLPNLVQHRGAESFTMPGERLEGRRVSTTWAPDFDARQVLR